VKLAPGVRLGPHEIVAPIGRSYDIAVDGSRFLMIKTAGSPAQFDRCADL
jgi:hypothetical protein